VPKELHIYITLSLDEFIIVKVEIK
jgi:hypothetical protein